MSPALLAIWTRSFRNRVSTTLKSESTERAFRCSKEGNVQRPRSKGPRTLAGIRRTEELAPFRGEEQRRKGGKRSATDSKGSGQHRGRFLPLLSSRSIGGLRQIQRRWCAMVHDGARLPLLPLLLHPALTRRNRRALRKLTGARIDFRFGGQPGRE